MSAASVAPFGVTSGGEAVSQITLDNGVLSCQVLTYGAILRSLWVPDRTGTPVDVVLGYETLGEYERDTTYFGATVGRCANRIAKGHFQLNGTTYTLACNNGENHLHGGPVGLTHRVWTVSKVEADSVELSLFSPDGEEGYPGNLTVKVTYRLVGQALEIHYRAQSDADTLCNLTNHSYFNLNGHDSGDVLNQTLRLCAEEYTPSGVDSIPFGTLEPVAGTPMDFQQAHPIGEHIHDSFDQLQWARGYDHNYVVSGQPGTLRPAAEAFGAERGIVLTASTTLPGMHLYTANYVEAGCAGKQGAVYGPRHGFCLEMQYFPDAIHQPAFLSPILKAGETYDHTTRFAFSCK